MINKTQIPQDSFIRQNDNPGAVLNTDSSGLAAYKKRKNRENEINTLKEEVSEIKSLLTTILQKIDNK
jgi:hypothetical protein